MAKTVIQHAKELVAEKGKDEAIKYFKGKLDEMGIPTNFEDICKQSAWEIAIDYINNEIKI